MAKCRPASVLATIALALLLGVAGCELVVDSGGLTGGSAASDASTIDSGIADVNATDSGTLDTGSPSSFAFIQVIAGEIDDASSGEIALNAPTQAGNALLVATDFKSTTGTVLITDDQGDTFTNLGGPLLKSNSGEYAALSAALNIQGGVRIITATIVGGGIPDGIEVYAHEYHGLAKLDGTSSAAGTSADTDGMQSGSAQTTGAQDLIFGWGDTGSGTAGTGFTIRSNYHDNVTEDRLVTGPGNYQATATMTGGSGWAMLMAAFITR